ncbi:hypothetical protein KW787_02710 [Candidatus Pacearchaeota archaeon]|nr:hypothetical protein [Candidatus Pacearchaeota archaeon]
MKARTYNPRISYYHELWAANALGMRVNDQDGADLIDRRKIIEVKFTLDNPSYTRSWTVFEHQLSYNQEKAGYWGLGVYQLDRSIKKIKEDENLEDSVGEREIYLVEWDWMNQFPPHSVSGKTKSSAWEYILRYPKAKLLPPTTHTYKVNKGKVYITEGVDARAIKVLGSLISHQRKKRSRVLCDVPF